MGWEGRREGGGGAVEGRKRESSELRSASASGRLGPLKICANSRCSRSRQSDLSRRQPSVCGAPKCHKGAAWATV